MQMRKISHFLVYIDDANEWQETTINDLAQVNELESNIIPVYSNGEFGKQTTWGEYQAAQAKEKEARQKPQKGFWQSVGDVLTGDIDAHIKQQTQHEKQASNNITVKPKKESSTDAQFHEINLTMPLVRKSCRLFFMLFWLYLYTACIGLSLYIAYESDSPIFFGVLAGFAVAAILHFIVNQVVSDS